MASHPSRPSIHDQRSPVRRQSSSSTNYSAGEDIHPTRSRRRQPTRPQRSNTIVSSPPASITEAQSTVLSDRVGSHSGSPRGSPSSTMRTSTTSIGAPVTYTPTTHRISKAKKGKRVHACEFPGCSKIFTRAEHKRRHELNHSPEASFPCKYTGCRKAFHRPDLLARHLERHELEGQSQDPAYGVHRRHSSHASTTSDAASAMTTTSMNSPPLTVHNSSGHPSSHLSIGSLVHPSTGQDYSSGNITFHIGQYSGNAGSLYPAMVQAQTADEGFMYSSPESSQSPIPDHYAHFPNHRNSISSSNSITDYYNPPTTSPLMATTIPGWTPVLPPSALPPHIINEEGSVLPSVGSPVPIPLSNLDGHEWFALRRELSTAPGVISGDDGMEIFDTVKWQDCFECYWRHFHPLFPVVHRPTFFATKPSPLMAGAMVAIGAQYDTRPNAKEYSLALLEASSKLLSKRDNIDSRSRITDIQTVFLLEILSKFRSRRADVRASPRFRSLYASLARDRHWMSMNPTAALMAALKKSSPDQPKTDELKSAHKFWVEHETRRRILQASYVLDTHQAALFEQLPALIQAPLSRVGATEGKTDMPFPCDDVLWESSPIEEWLVHAKAFAPQTLPEATEAALSDTSEKFDAFQTSLVLSHILVNKKQTAFFEQQTKLFMEHIEKFTTPPSCARSLFSCHALLTAHYTPVRHLLSVSGETWLFNKKLEQEAAFHLAKTQLREWTQSGSAKRALWHATEVLRRAFAEPTTYQDSPSNMTGGNKPAELAGDDLCMLHEKWAIYVSALVCWACGFDAANAASGMGLPLAAPTMSRGSFSSASSSSGIATPVQLIEPSDAEADMWEFLSAMQPGRWEDFGEVDAAAKSRTNGLIECVRTQKMRGPLGGLLNEAERVLFKLVEGRSRLSHF